MTLQDTFVTLGIALGLGLLVGLQRQKVDKELAGLRTFPIVTILGCLCAIMSEFYGGWPIAAGLLGTICLVILGNIVQMKTGSAGPGLTTEFAIVLMFLVGAYLVKGYREIAIAIAGGTVVLLHFKQELHGVAKRLGRNDLEAIVQLALVSMVILPILPDKTFGPFSVLNPRDIWLMVVLIVVLSLSGYVVYKFVGEKVGILLGGILGGMISSTATTVSYAQRTRDQPKTAPLAVVVIMIASTIVFARVLVEIWVVSPEFLKIAGPPLIASALFLVGLSFLSWIRGRSTEHVMPPQQNPSQLKAAVIFGGLYAAVLFSVAAAKHLLGSEGLYIVSVLSGLTDMDAITLSTARLVESKAIDSDQGWRMVLVAAMSNLVFKGGIVATLGNRELFKQILWLFAVALIATALIIWLWPKGLLIP
jgi:uncharacterized membrane protein (DUF4010 family)